MKRTLWVPMLAWLGAAAAALALAFASPSKITVMGKLPSPAAQRLVRPGQAPERVLALVGFDRSQRGEIKSWVDGLRLCEQQAIPWIRMAVLRDPGDEASRRAAERRLLDSHDTRQSARVVPIFTDRDAFAREAGLSGREHASVLVVNREGHVLAKAEGQFDAARADALRQALVGPEAPLP